jgi:hypothetical protein
VSCKLRRAAELERHRQRSAEQAKALLAILIADLRVNSRDEILPTYRVGAPVVCAQTSSVERTVRCANPVVVHAQSLCVA